MVSGRLPNRLESRTRAPVPPTEVCTTLRIDMCAKPSRLRGSAAAGAADQVPTQFPEEAGAAELRARGESSPRPWSRLPAPMNIAVETRTTSAASPASRA